MGVSPGAYALCSAALGAASVSCGLALGGAGAGALVRHGLATLLSASVVAASAWSRSARAAEALRRNGSFPFGAARVALAAVVAQGVFVCFAALSDLLHTPPGPRAASVPFLLGSLGVGALGHALMEGRPSRRDRPGDRPAAAASAADLVAAACRGHAGADALRALGALGAAAWTSPPLSLVFLARAALNAWSTRLVAGPLAAACAVLMDGVPPGSRAPLRQALADVAAIDGVLGVPEYRAFGIEPGVLCVTAHVVVARGLAADAAARQRVLGLARGLLARAGASDITVEIDVGQASA